MSVEIPQPVRRHLEKEVLERALVAWFQVDDSGRVVDHGASEEDFAAELRIGDPIIECVPVMVGMLPLSGQTLLLRSVELDSKYFVDLHAFEEGDRTWVLFVDESGHREAFEELLRKVNADELTRTNREALADRLTDVACAFDVAFFEPTGGGSLRLVTRPPEWLRLAMPALRPGQRVEAESLSNFVANFIAEDDPWISEKEELVRSLPWLEEVNGYGPMVRECVAGMSRPNRPFLAVRRLGKDIRDRIAPIQAGRDLGLLHEALTREIEEKEILHHCVVHDLANPLSNLRSCLDLLGSEEDLSPRQKELLDAAQSEAARQSNLIHTILDLFRSERTNRGVRVDETSGSDLKAAIEALRPGMEAACRTRGLVLSIDYGAEEDLHVVGDSIRLERVIQNLFENALRVAPLRSKISVGVSRLYQRVRVAVEDEGPGVPESVQPELFKKLRSSGVAGGKLGLGLYFCRITVKSWGGELRQMNLSPRGCRFEFELPVRQSQP